MNRHLMIFGLVLGLTGSPAQAAPAELDKIPDSDCTVKVLSPTLSSSKNEMRFEIKSEKQNSVMLVSTQSKNNAFSINTCNDPLWGGERKSSRLHLTEADDPRFGKVVIVSAKCGDTWESVEHFMQLKFEKESGRMLAAFVETNVAFAWPNGSHTGPFKPHVERLLCGEGLMNSAEINKVLRDAPQF